MSSEHPPQPDDSIPTVSFDFSDTGQGASDQDTQPSNLDRYELFEEIARGGQGAVYKAKQLATGRQAAVKILDRRFGDNERAVARFDREVRVLAALDHPHIVKVLDRGVTSDGRHYLAMDLVRGQGLDQFMKTYRKGNPPLEIPEDPAKILTLFRKICLAVYEAHRHGIVHRDLKPSNVLIDDRDEPRVLDFGLARTLSPMQEQEVSLTGQFLGSLPWSSPEQAEGEIEKIDARTDVYALGVMLYQMLTGEFPYSVAGTMREVLNRIVGDEPASPSQVIDTRIAQAVQKQQQKNLRLVNPINPALEAIILKALAKRPKDRYNDAGALADEIGSYLAGRKPAEQAVVEASAPVASTTNAQGKATATVIAIALAAVLLVVLIAAVIYINPDNTPAPQEQASSTETHTTATVDDEASAPPARPQIEHVMRFADEQAEASASFVFISDHEIARPDGKGLWVYDLNDLSDGQSATHHVPYQSALADPEAGPWFIEDAGAGYVAVWTAPAPDDAAETEDATATQEERQVMIVRAADGHVRQVVRGLTVNGHGIAVSPDGRYLAVAHSPNNEVAEICEIFDLENPDAESVACEHVSNWQAGRPAFSPDGKMLALPSLVAGVRLFDTQTGAYLDTINQGHEAHSQAACSTVCFASDRPVLYTGGLINTMQAWNWETKQPLANLCFGAHDPTFDYCTIALSADGRYAAAGSRMTGDIHLVDARNFDILQTLPNKNRANDIVPHIAFSPQGRWLVASSNNKRGFNAWRVTAPPIESDLLPAASDEDATSAQPGPWHNLLTNVDLEDPAHFNSVPGQWSQDHFGRLMATSVLSEPGVANPQQRLPVRVVEGSYEVEVIFARHAAEEGSDTPINGTTQLLLPVADHEVRIVTPHHGMAESSIVLEHAKDENPFSWLIKYELDKPYRLNARVIEQADGQAQIVVSVNGEQILEWTGDVKQLQGPKTPNVSLFAESAPATYYTVRIRSLGGTLALEN